MIYFPSILMLLVMISNVERNPRKRIVTNQRVYAMDPEEKAKLLPEQELYCNLYQGCQCANVCHWNINEDMIVLEKFVELDGARTWAPFHNLLKNRSIDAIRRRMERIDGSIK